jgi:hypothetical protein
MAKVKKMAFGGLNKVIRGAANAVRGVAAPAIKQATQAKPASGPGLNKVIGSAVNAVRGVATPAINQAVKMTPQNSMGGFRSMMSAPMGPRSDGGIKPDTVGMGQMAGAPVSGIKPVLGGMGKMLGMKSGGSSSKQKSNSGRISTAQKNKKTPNW